MIFKIAFNLFFQDLFFLDIVYTYICIYIHILLWQFHFATYCFKLVIIIAFTLLIISLYIFITIKKIDRIIKENR